MRAARVRSLSSRRGLAALAVSAFVLLGIVAACTDGTTPDCSDAATPCGPNVVEASADGADATNDAKLDTSLPDTAVPDTGPDADLDAGDEI